MTNRSNAPAPTNSSGPDFAWRVHAALNEWTGKVDAKASIVLSLETAILGAVIAFSAPSGLLGELKAGAVHYFRAGVFLLAAAVVISGLVVLPQLNRWKSRKSGNLWRENAIYFGHLRHWSPEDLEKHLANLDSGKARLQLANQLVEMGKIAWRKHSRLQISMGLAAIGSLSLAVAGFFGRVGA